MTRVAAVIIGDEILSGSVRDTNAGHLIETLRALDVDLGRLAVIGDDVEEIAEEVRRAASGFDLVVTSGGLGPTHDDRTVEGVSRAFSVEVVRHREMEAMIRRFWRGRRTEEALRMADVPRGSRLLYGDDFLLPVIAIANVYLLPGVPRLFRAKLECLRDELAATPHHRRSLYLRADETEVAWHLDRVDREFAAVKVGSYPQPEAVGHTLWITFAGADPAEVEAALTRLLELLPAEQVVGTSPPPTPEGG